MDQETNTRSGHDHEASGISFVAFVLSLAHTAAAHLVEVQHASPGSAAPEPKSRIILP